MSAGTEMQRCQWPAVLVRFDLLEHDGESAARAPLSERRNVLHWYVAAVPGLQLIQHIETHGEALFRVITQLSDVHHYGRAIVSKEIRMRISTYAGILLMAWMEVAAAQVGDHLPSKLSGRWMYVGPKTYINPVAIEFDGDGKPGPIAGHLTWRGVTCGAENERFTGTWDGKELHFRATLRANVNVQRMNGQCGEADFVLKRKPGEHSFDGDARASYTDAVPTISVSP